MNQRQVAAKMGISEAYVSLILSGVRRFPWAMAKKAGELFECDPVIFLEGTTEEQKTAFGIEDKNEQKS